MTLHILNTLSEHNISTSGNGQNCGFATFEELRKFSTFMQTYYNLSQVPILWKRTAKQNT